MAQSAVHKHETTRRATYQDVLDAPAHRVAEVIDRTLYTHPRPAMPHPRANREAGACKHTYRHAIRGKGGVIPLECHTIDGNATPERRHSMHASAEERKRWARDTREANRQAILEGCPGGHPEIVRQARHRCRTTSTETGAEHTIRPHLRLPR